MYLFLAFQLFAIYIACSVLHTSCTDMLEPSHTAMVQYVCNNYVLINISSTSSMYVQYEISPCHKPRSKINHDMCVNYHAGQVFVHGHRAYHLLHAPSDNCTRIQSPALCIIFNTRIVVATHSVCIGTLRNRCVSSSICLSLCISIVNPVVEHPWSPC